MYATPLADLPADVRSLWQVLHERSLEPLSPFLHPAYADAAGAAGSSVEVGVITRDGRAVGVLPYERRPFGVGGAVGSRLCDVAGAVVLPGISWDPVRLMKAAGLRLLRLPHVPHSQPTLQRFLADPVAAPVIDLSRGYEAYRTEHMDSGSALMKQIDRRERRAERKVGPVRFEWNSRSDGLFATLMEWKSAQRRQTRTPNALALPRVQALLERLRCTDSPEFGGVLSALYVGDDLAALHFGIRSSRVLHYWIPAYNPRFARFSPGLLCLMALARASAERGIELLDLGAGEERYKMRAASLTPDIATLTVTNGAAVELLVRAFDAVRAVSRGSTLEKPLRDARRAVTRGAYSVRGALAGTGSKAVDR